jgi:hypothetical protein
MEDGLKELLEELGNMLVGYSIDLDWTSNLTCPSIEEYLRMVDFSKLACHISLESWKNSMFRR